MLAGRTDQLEAIEASVSAAVAADDGATAASESMTLYYGLQAQRGAAEACDFAARAGLQLADLGYESRGAELVAESAQSAIFAGRLEETVRHVDELLEEPFGRRSRQRLLYNRGYALGMLGRFDDAERTFVEVEAFATRDFDGLGTVLWCWAEASFWSGRPARALEQADAALEITAWNGAEYVLPSVARAWAEVELGKEPSPLAAKPEFACLYGAEPELRGLQSLHAGDTRQATAEFEAAAGMWAGFHIPRELVCRWAAADAVRRSGDLPAAIDRLREVADRSDAIGFEPLSARVRRSLRLAGDRVHAHAQPKPASELLTAREREVLGLVERGLTRIEIARRMGLGRPTVARMLSNAMLKVGAENRLQAIAMAGEGR
jgi:DNA-binding CsgD family transcriptional regulator